MPELPRRRDRAAATPPRGQERAPQRDFQPPPTSSNFQPPPTPPLPPRPADCGCDSELQPLLLRVAAAEAELVEVRRLLRDAVEGLQSSMTGLSHRLNKLEDAGPVQGVQGGSGCVATREGANLPGLPHGGMDS